jgi:transcriptional regulator with PAS, ATPase and Fis domain
MQQLQNIKQRFGIIGNYPNLNRALEKAIQVSPTDISVLVMGESGVGKEFIPKIIHSLSARKHQPYVVVNCGAIPEGTIDSELFGHEKGSFTGATSTRKGYFEMADHGTIFLDEVGELPLQTQVRLLRVLESGEFMKVGSSQVQKTNVRVVAATNVNMLSAIQKGEFREDLYYRLNTVQIDMPPLRERMADVHLLFRKFAIDFAEKYRMPEISLTPDAVDYLLKYNFPGNVRQLRNLVEQITVVEPIRQINAPILQNYIPLHAQENNLVSKKNSPEADFGSEREILYKILFDMRSDINDLKNLTAELIKNNGHMGHKETELINRIYQPAENNLPSNSLLYFEPPAAVNHLNDHHYKDDYGVEEIYLDDDKDETNAHDFSLQNHEKELIIKALEKHKGRRNKAADELGISQRTLYRKIKQFNLDI